MIELAFGPIDAARVRFAISPLAETVWSTVAFRKPQQRWLHRSWRDRAAGALDPADVDLVFAMTSGRTYLPDFLTPTPPIGAVSGHSVRRTSTTGPRWPPRTAH
jgi:hypothetical protein